LLTRRAIVVRSIYLDCSLSVLYLSLLLPLVLRSLPALRTTHIHIHLACLAYQLFQQRFHHGFPLLACLFHDLIETGLRFLPSP